MPKIHPGWLQRLLQPDLPTHQVGPHGGRAPLRRRGHHHQPGSGMLEEFDLYRVSHLLMDLGWVDFGLGCSTILLSRFCQISPAQAESGRRWNSPNPSQPNPGSPGDWSPCSTNTKITNTTFHIMKYSDVSISEYGLKWYNFHSSPGKTHNLCHTSWSGRERIASFQSTSG